MDTPKFKKNGKLKLSLLDRIQKLVAAVVGAHFGEFIIVALYYLLLGATWTPLKPVWHQVVPDDALRHTFRGVGEGLLGGSLGQILAFDLYKVRKKSNKKANLLDRIEMKLRIPNIKETRRLHPVQMAAAPLYIIAYAIPGFALSWLALKGLHQQVDQHTALGHSYWSHVQAIWTSETNQKIIGLVASVFMARRPLKKIAHDIQLYFVEKRVAKGLEPRWYHTKPYKARFLEVQAGGVDPSCIKHDGIQGAAMTVALLTGTVLAGYGYYILTVIA